MEPVKPAPLGLTPRRVVELLRLRDILAAMDRYVMADKAIPKAWVEELTELIDRARTRECVSDSIQGANPGESHGEV